MKQLLQTLFFFLLVTQICFAQWVQQNSGTDKNLNAVTFTDLQNGFAVGDSGTVLKTNNGGISWLSISSGTNLALMKVAFINADNGWIVGGRKDEWWNDGDSSIILHTSNGGTNWLTYDKINKSLLEDVFFIDNNIGFIAGVAADSFVSHSLILKTNNGGNTWTSNYDTLGPIIRIQFINANTGWMLMSAPGMWGYYSTIYRTEDGGSNWSSILENHGGGPKAKWDPQVFDIHFFDSNNGFAIGTGRGFLGGVVYRTTDGGDTWIDTLTVDSLGNQFQFNKAYFSDINQGIAVGWDGNIYKTINGGLTWNFQTNGLTNKLNGIYFVDTNNGWTVGDNGTILHTTNGGVTFVEENEIDEIPTAFLLSQNYPNPFNPSTKIKYSVPQLSQVQIKIYDMLGNEIETLFNEEKVVGIYEIVWNAASLPSGVYFYQLRAGSFIETKKMILMK
jgi:photosystem II stability/assembly factor-like uncharacterized protein